MGTMPSQPWRPIFLKIIQEPTMDKIAPIISKSIICSPFSLILSVTIYTRYKLSMTEILQKARKFDSSNSRILRCVQGDALSRCFHKKTGSFPGKSHKFCRSGELLSKQGLREKVQNGRIKMLRPEGAAENL